MKSKNSFDGRYGNGSNLNSFVKVFVCVLNKSLNTDYGLFCLQGISWYFRLGV